MNNIEKQLKHLIVANYGEPDVVKTEVYLTREHKTIIKHKASFFIEDLVEFCELEKER